MEYYLTTYTKDFKWPVRSPPAKLKLIAENQNLLVKEQVKPSPCATYQSEPINNEFMIDPAQCGAPPAGPESKFGQPQTYLRKLYLKYPYLYQILKLTPPEELAKVLYTGKYITTYTADFNVEGFGPLKESLIPVEEERPVKEHTGVMGCKAEDVNLNANQTPNLTEIKGGVNPQPPCGCTHATGGAQIVDPVRKIAKKPRTISKIPRAPISCKKTNQDDKRPPEYSAGSHPPKLSKWKTEYRDTISKIGGIIIQKKLLTRVPAES